MNADAIVEEARERGPAFEHVLHGFGDVIAARELGALRAHPAFQIGDQWRCRVWNLLTMRWRRSAKS